MVSSGENEPSESSLHGELTELWSAVKPLLRRIPNVRKAIDNLTGGVSTIGFKALASRLQRYRTENLKNEAQQIASTTGQPLPVVLNQLVKQRCIDELMIDALRRVEDSADNQSTKENDGEAEAESRCSTDRWFQAFYNEAGAVDEEDVREAFVRILAGEIQSPGSYSLQTLRIMGAINRSVAQHFCRAASASIRLTPDGSHIIDARIPAVGGTLGQNCLKAENLSYDVLIQLTENGLVHPDYGSYHHYGPLDLPLQVQQTYQIPFVHQEAMWVLEPNSEKNVPVRVAGAKFTSCGVELLKIVDIDPLPIFTAKLVSHFSKSGYRMVRSNN